MKLPKLSNISVDGSTVGDLYFPQTELLLPFDGTNGATSTSDLSNGNISVTFGGNAAISTAQSKFGGSSLYIPSSNVDTLDFGSISSLYFPNDFTIEFWFLSISGADSSAFILNSGSSYLAINYDYGNSRINLYLNSTGPTAINSQVLTSWSHIALSRSGSALKLYVNGTSVYSATNSSALGWTSPTLHRIGGGSAAAFYIDDFRVTVAQARYTSNFTPPTTSHLTSAGDVNKQIIVNSAADGVAIGTGGISQARIAKAWANIDGAQTAASMIQSSYNISSITDHGVGIYSFNFSTAMADAHYAVTTGIGHVVDGAQSIPEFLIQNQTTALIKINARYSSGSAAQANYDYNTCCMTVFGN
jgi:hypothetical protein